MNRPLRIHYPGLWYSPSLARVLSKTLVAGAMLAIPVMAQANNHALLAKTSITQPAPQDIQVTGRVVDEQGESLPGLSVTIKGTTQGTVTDVNGKYSLTVKDQNAVLVFSFTGFATQEEVVRQRSVVNVQMAVSSKSLSDVVVVGYNTQKRATLTGSISEVKGAELVRSPQPNLSNSFAGRISGVIVNNRSGEPGYDGSGITIRGLATTGNTSVLVVVDGVPGQLGGLERLDPNDVESVSVLKDASAAIYGNRAANGVILVTTKRGKTGKPMVN